MEALLQILRIVLRELDHLKEHGHALLNRYLNIFDDKKISKEGILAAHQLLWVAEKYVKS